MSNLLVTLLTLASFLFIARAVLSWFRLGPDSPFYAVSSTVDRITEPVIAPIRRVLPPMGGLDLSVLIVILAINFILIPIARSL